MDCIASRCELGVKLDAVISDWQAEVRLYRDETNVWNAACEAAGLPRLEFGEVPREEWNARNEARRELWYPEKAEHDAREAATHDEHGMNIVWTDIHGRLYPIVDDILARRAQTIAGLAVQARAAVMSEAHIWDARGEETERVFIEAVCAFVGVKPEQLLVSGFVHYMASTEPSVLDAILTIRPHWRVIRGRAPHPQEQHGAADG